MVGAERLQRLTSELLGLVAELQVSWAEERAQLQRRVTTLEAELASWGSRERELRRELDAVRAELGPPSPEAPPEAELESSGLEAGEMREAFAAARRASGTRRPRWADELDPGDASG